MLATAGSYEASTARRIEADVLVIAYVSPKVMRAVYVRDDPDHVVQFTTGTYHTQDWIGKIFGSVVYPRKRRPNLQPLCLLTPTPELWTRVLTHRTQILYLADIALICTFLELKPGSVVLESGTGSGSLTHALARAVAPTGHVHTFEFHQDRCATAENEFVRHGLSHIVTVQQRDVQSHGFPEAFTQHRVDGVFLDVPEPWKVVSSAVSCLRPGHCLTMTETECIIDLRIMECIAEEYRVKSEPLATDLHAYHAQKSIPPGMQNSGKGEGEPTEDGNALSMVTNTRIVGLKGHTGFLIVGRRFANA